MPNEGSLDVLPLSSCTSGSLGLDHHFLGTVPLKVVENRSTSSLKESLVTQEEQHAVVVVQDDAQAEVKDENEVEEEDEDNEDKEEEEEEYEDEATLEATVGHHAVVAHEEVKEEEVKDEVEDEVKDLIEKTDNLAVTTTSSNSEEQTVDAVPEKIVSGIPQRPVRSAMPTHVAARGLSAASLALKKKQAAENAAAATKAMAVEIPETDSISNRIKMFGGATTNRSTCGGVVRKMNVRDMVRKFKDVEDLKQEEITHVSKGHADPRGVCSAYSLSTASRPANALRPIPRRKMSHELADNETRAAVVRATVGGRHNFEDSLGVSSESVQSVRNAKSIFESLGRSEGAQP
ncbi:hypothetical protein BGZ94_008562 [Podila epigama]|nr:hypothetical protein BGZ94_008562 [Podila epigama]